MKIMKSDINYENLNMNIEIIYNNKKIVKNNIKLENLQKLKLKKKYMCNNR